MKKKEYCSVCNVSEFLLKLRDVEDGLRNSILERHHKKAILNWLDEDIEGGRFFYRGQSDADWGLEPGLFRKRWVQNKRFSCNKNLILVDSRHSTYVEQEWDVLAEVERRYASYFSDCRSTLDKLAVLQHYGLPTRLLDVTNNSMVALYNAIGAPVREENTNGEYSLNYKVDGRVYVFFIPLRDYESAYGCQSKNISYADIRYSYVKRLPSKRPNAKKLEPQFVCPTFLTARQSRQQGSFFLVPSKGNGEFCGKKILATALREPAEFDEWRYEAIQIPRADKEAIRKELASHCGICDQFLYPESPDGYRQDLLDDLDSRIEGFNI